MTFGLWLTCCARRSDVFVFNPKSPHTSITVEESHFYNTAAANNEICFKKQTGTLGSVLHLKQKKNNLAVFIRNVKLHSVMGKQALPMES